MKQKLNLGETLSVAYRLLSSSEKRRATIVVALSFFGGVADIISLMAVYPLISILIQPALLETNLHIHYLWEITGSPSLSIFAIMLAALASLILIFGTTINILSQVQANRFAAFCQERLGRELMTALIRAPYIWHLEHNPLVLGSLFQSHIVVWSRDVIRRIGTMTGQLATIILPVAVLIGWSPFNGVLILIFAIGLLTILLRFIRRRTVVLLHEKKQAEQQLHVFITEILQGIKDLKLSSRESDFLRAFMRSYHITSLNYSSANNWALLPSQFVLIAGQFGILGIGVGLFLYGVEGGQLASTMAIVVLVASRVFPAMNRLGTSINGLNNVGAWINTLDEIDTSLRRYASTARISTKATKRLEWSEIVIREATFTYPNTVKPALQTINLQLCKGGAYAFVGMSGAGKSTLVDLILGLLEPSTGSVEVDGKKLDESIRDVWQVGIGYVPQLPMILDVSLRENIAFGIPSKEINDAKVLHCLSLAHLTDILGGLSDGLYTPLGDRGIRLSGGQRQRVAIARALYNDPDILVLDEAMSALDAISERAFCNALMDLYGKITIISIAHRFSTIRYFDSIFLMEHGKIIAQGSYDALLLESELFRRLITGTDEH